MTKSLKGSIYDYPKYYDLVFGSDWKAEYDFLRGCFELYGKQPVERVFEPACGTGRLLFRLGRAGFDVSGVDLNEKAVRYCNARLRRFHLPPAAFVGDMTDFRLPRKTDAAFNMINSFRHLRDESQAEGHLRSMGRALRIGGLYALGLHLTPTRGQPMEEESWAGRRGHLQVNTRLWTLHRDLRKRQERFGMTYDVFTPTARYRLYDEIVFRTYTARQFRQLIRRTELFEIAATFDFAYDVESPIQVDPYTEDVVYLLRRA